MSTLGVCGPASVPLNPANHPYGVRVYLHRSGAMVSCAPAARPVATVSAIDATPVTMARHVLIIAAPSCVWSKVSPRSLGGVAAPLEARGHRLLDVVHLRVL